MPISVNLSPGEWNGRNSVPLRSKRSYAEGFTRLYKQNLPSQTGGKSTVLKPAQAGFVFVVAVLTAPLTLS
jgi:hypothetical protein